MLITIAIFIFLIWLASVFASGQIFGYNNGDFFVAVREAFSGRPLSEWHGIYKAQLNKLSKNQFTKMKIRGVRPVARSRLKASRGYDKIKEILMLTRFKVEGRVLSLCCGAGGWEQAIAPNPDVTEIKAVTFGSGKGHEGHKNFTDTIFEGRHKVKLHYGDARTYPVTDHDWLLFDGGESRSKVESEARLFKQLFSQTVMRQISPKTKGFILKVLVPSDPEMIEMMKYIQKVTGKGCLMRSSHSRASTMECYFVSMPKMNVEESVRSCLRDFIQRGEANVGLDPVDYGPGYSYYRAPVENDILPPLDLGKSIDECGERLNAEPRPYNHWEAKGVYAMGSRGSSGMKYNNIGARVLRYLIPNLIGFDKWKVTDTTANFFHEMFRRKIDKSPLEDHDYVPAMQQIYSSMADYFMMRGFKYKRLSDEEVIQEANKQGAPGFQDIEHNNVGSFLKDKRWRKIVAKYEKMLLDGTPLGAVYNIMSKKEKKYMDKMTGSRMIAYLPIPMRMLELRTFGCLLKLTKPILNRFGVGGLGLHDLGMRMNEVWSGFKNPGGTSTDVASFDTRISAVILKMECDFIMQLGGGDLVRRFYQIYSHPLIMIPIPGEYIRSELLQGRGQRMSGSHVTYTMNTMTRIMLLILQSCVADGRVDDAAQYTKECMEGKHLGGCVSGDDEVTIGEEEDVERMIKAAHVLHDVGFPRKNIPREVLGHKATSMEELDFCSHHYVPITYYDESTGEVTKRWAPTRDVTEIVAKSIIRIGGGDELSDEAWLSCQGNNLLVNYHHLRTVRAAGLAFKASTNPNLVLTDKGGFLRPTPWMRPGDILDITNDVLFGSGTHYPVPGFRVRSMSHLGYISPKLEKTFDPEFHCHERYRWRKTLHTEVEETIITKSTGGDPAVMDLWRVREFD
nr:MAG: NS5-like protein [Flaviviridae sp.]